jgi:hypothetical protein
MGNSWNKHFSNKIYAIQINTGEYQWSLFDVLCVNIEVTLLDEFLYSCMSRCSV